MRRPRLVYVATHPVSADLLLQGQLAFMRESGFEVTVVAAPGPELDRVATREKVRTVAIPLAREIDPRLDIVSLRELVALFRDLQPDIVNAGTPKGGLLGSMAARAVGVPVRIYLLRGLRLETVRGTLRRVLTATERIASACAHDVACVSQSLLDVSVAGGFVPRAKAIVVGAGSSNGVDTARFERTEAQRRRGADAMQALGIAPDAPVIGFVGRLDADKGIRDVLAAFDDVRREIPNARLALLGGDLADQRIDPALAEAVHRADGVVATGRIDDLAPYYARMNALAFPSYREGFPNVVLEAASARVPVVGFRSTGVVDAIVDGETGTLVAQGDVRGLASSLVTYLKSPELSARHGEAARARATRLFSRNAVWNAWLAHYARRLDEAGLPLPAPPS